METPLLSDDDEHLNVHIKPIKHLRETLNLKSTCLIAKAFAKMNSVLFFFAACVINLAYCQYGYQAAGNQMVVPNQMVAPNQMNALAYSQTTTYQQQPNGQQTTYVQETIQQPSGASKTVLTKTVSQPVMTQPTAYNNYGRKKRNADESSNNLNDLSSQSQMLSEKKRRTKNSLLRNFNYD